MPLWQTILKLISSSVLYVVFCIFTTICHSLLISMCFGIHSCLNRDFYGLVFKPLASEQSTQTTPTDHLGRWVGTNQLVWGWWHNRGWVHGHFKTRTRTTHRVTVGARLKVSLAALSNFTPKSSASASPISVTNGGMFVKPSIKQLNYCAKYWREWKRFCEMHLEQLVTANSSKYYDEYDIESSDDVLV